MTDTATIAMNQRAFLNSDATRRWVSEQARIDRLFEGVASAIINAAAPRPGESVLDIGCGTGTILLKMAEAVGPEGEVLGVDISEQQLALARRRIDAAAATRARVLLDDAATHAFPSAVFDLAVTRFGVMFFADPVAAFTNIRRAMKPGGRLAMAVFRPGSENPWATASLSAIRHLVTLPPPPGPEEPGQFGWGDPARVRRILGGAGFHDVALTPLDLPITLGANAAEAAEFAMFIGQGARLLHGLPDATREAARSAFETRSSKHMKARTASVCRAGLWLVSAVK